MLGGGSGPDPGSVLWVSPRPACPPLCDHLGRTFGRARVRPGGDGRPPSAFLGMPRFVLPFCGLWQALGRRYHGVRSPKESAMKPRPALLSFLAWTLSLASSPTLAGQAFSTEKVRGA